MLRLLKSNKKFCLFVWTSGACIVHWGVRFIYCGAPVNLVFVSWNKKMINVRVNRNLGTDVLWLPTLATIQQHDTFKRAIGILVIWLIHTDILTRTAGAIVVKIPVWICPFARTAMARLNGSSCCWIVASQCSRKSAPAVLVLSCAQQNLNE